MNGQAQVVQHIRHIVVVTEGDVAHFDPTADLVNRQLFSGYFRFRLQDRFRHLQDRTDGRHGEGNSGQCGESAHHPAVSGAERVILALRHTGFHRQVIQHDCAAQGNRGCNHGVQFHECRRIVFEPCLFGVQPSPAGEHPFFRPGKPDFLDPVQDGIAHAAFFCGQLHLFPGNADLDQGSCHTDDDRCQNNQYGRPDQGRGKLEDLRDIQQGHQAAQADGQGIVQDHAAQGVDAGCPACQFAGGEPAEEADGQRQDPHHDGRLDCLRGFGINPRHQQGAHQSDQLGSESA